MNTEQSYKEGYLLFQTQGMLGHLKKSWHRKFCQLFKASKHGIERLEVFDNEEDKLKNSAVRIITLENCVKITPDVQKHQPFVFAVVTKVSVHHFASLSENDMSEWISALQAVAFKDDFSRQMIEDNDLYCPSGEGVFSVRLAPSDASTRCGLEPGPYTLVVTTTALELKESNSHQLLFTWPYRYIRRYGTRTGKFTFEAGRKCDTGEGEFQLEHSNQQEIFRCMSSKMKSMRQLLSGESLPALVSTDCQFQAALGMLPRSRSPLLPSPTSATSAICELDFSCSSGSQSSLQASLSRQPPPLLPKPISNKPTLTLAKPTPPAKPSKPTKPPRKNLENPHNREQGFAPCHPSSAPTTPTDDYDKIEVRKDAWRTFGMEEMMHTEREVSRPENADDYEDIDAPRDEPCAPPLLQEQQSCPAIFMAPRTDSSDNYDKLEHFGSSSRLNTRSGYRQLGTLKHASSMPRLELPPLSSKLWTDDDLATDSIESCRRADDSHYGYGMIRKKSLPTETVSAPFTLNLAGPSHQMCNEQEYAIVLKAKWV